MNITENLEYCCYNNSLAKTNTHPSHHHHGRSQDSGEISEYHFKIRSYSKSLIRDAQMGRTNATDSVGFPDLWGLTANEVANRKSTAGLSLQEYHINQDVDANSEVRTIENVALYPIHLLLKNLSPFNYSIQNDHAVPQSFVPVFSNAIKLYQLYIFFIYALSELGSVHAKKILEIQTKHIEKWLGSKQTFALAECFDDISITAKEHTKQHYSDLHRVSLDIPIEQSIAKIFLLRNKASPLYAKSDVNSYNCDVNFRGIDLALADHLGMAKDQALEAYAHYFNIVIVEA